MKKSLALLLAAVMLLSFSASALGALHAGGEMVFGPWYYLAPDQPYLQGYGISMSGTISGYMAGVEYFQNDQYFINLGNSKMEQGPITATATVLEGSYLFDFGLFVGLSYGYMSMGPISDHITEISPGYRWNLDDEHSYIAASVDYQYSAMAGTGEIDAYDLDAKYFTDTMKLSGELLIPGDGDPMSLDLSGCYAVSDALVAGADLYLDGSGISISGGLTYQQDLYILNAELSKSLANDIRCSLGGVYHVAEGFYAGGSVVFGPGAPVYTLEGNYEKDQTQFTLGCDFRGSQTAIRLSYQKLL